MHKSAPFKKKEKRLEVNISDMHPQVKSDGESSIKKQQRLNTNNYGLALEKEHVALHSATASAAQA